MSGRLPSSLVSVTGFGALFVGLLVDHFLDRRQRHDLVVEAPRLLRGRGAALALQREGVLHLARDAVALRDDVGGLDHRHPHLGLMLLEPILVDGRTLVRDQAAAFEAAGDDRVCFAGHDALRRHRDGLQAGAAEAVDGHARHRDRQAGADRGEARDVLAGRALRHRAAHDDVVDFAGIELGALDRVLDHVAAHGGAMRHVEGAAPGLADRRAGGRDDHGFLHGDLCFNNRGIGASQIACRARQGTACSPPPAKRWGGVGGGGLFDSRVRR